MRLWIAEKPAMARAIAEALPGNPRNRDGYIETAAGTVTWAIGHLLHPAMPEDYDPAHKQWCLERLPILPDQWQLKVSPQSKKQADIIRSLLRRADSVVHAGDAGREGQLIVQELLEHYDYRGPVKRLWLSALDPQSLNRAMGDLKDNDTYAGLHAAALARQRADWLVGINLTRLYTLHFSEARGRAARLGDGGAAQQVFSIGRVQTPTLRLIIDRERQIASFKPVRHYVPMITLETAAGAVSAKFHLRDDDTITTDPDGRITDKTEAERIRAASRPGPAVVQDYEAKDKLEPAPLPYSLDALQVDGNKIHDFTAARTLELAQALYEKHRIISYPRSDCRYLPHSQHQDAGAIIAGLAVAPPFTDWAKLANPDLCGRAFNDNKLSEHHAIIPTRICGQRAGLSEDKSKLFNLIARAYLAQFLSPHKYKAQKASFLTGGYLYTATARSVSDTGWKIILGQDPKDGDPAADHDDGADDAANGERTLPDLVPGQQMPVIDSYVQDSLTKAPPRFTDASLIAAMTSIHKYVADSDHKKHLKESDGIGTPATRAAIIENLIARKFVGRKGKNFQGLDAGRVLIDAVPERIKDPALTALFESRLRLMEDGRMDLALFQGMVERLISAAIADVKGGKVAMDLPADLMRQTIKGQTIKGQTIQGTGKPCPVCKTGRLVTRTARKGKNKGRRFLGCNRFTRTGCKYVQHSLMKGNPDALPE